MCGGDKCCRCNSTNDELPAVYCNECSKKLDTSDPIQDVSLMEYLVYGSVTKVKKQKDWERVLKLAERYMVTTGKLFRLYKYGAREVPMVCDRENLVEELHQASGHVGTTKLLSALR